MVKFLSWEAMNLPEVLHIFILQLLNMLQALLQNPICYFLEQALPAHISIVKNMVEDLLCSVQVVKDHLLEDLLLKSLTIPNKILGNEVSSF